MVYETPVDINVGKEHYNQNTFSSLEFSNVAIFDQKSYFWKIKEYKSPSTRKAIDLQIRSLRFNPPRC